MKRRLSIISLLLLLCIVVGSLASCEGLFGGEDNPPAEHVHVDIAGTVSLDMNSETIKTEVSVKNYIDGDTTHFNVPASIDPSGVIKARYLAINTPESTGKIEEWGVAASNFTKEKLSTAASIIIETDGTSWEYDGNGRALLWVWYKPSADAEYRNLNLELLQNGLAWGSKAEEGRYGKVALDATAQALKEELYLFSEEKDPDFPYEQAKKITIKELRTSLAEYGTKSEYYNKRVAIEGTVVYNADYTVFIVDTDPESGITYGMQLFLSYDNDLANMLLPGNRARVVGVVKDHYGEFQVTDLRYNAMRPNDPANTALISTGNPVNYSEITVEQFYSDVKVNIDDETEKTFKFASISLSTPVEIKNLKVVDTYTTSNGGSNDGAITITCKVGDMEIDIRTAVLKDANGNIVKESAFTGKTIDVKGIIEYFDLNNTGNGTYQVKVNYLSNITIH